MAARHPDPMRIVHVYKDYPPVRGGIEHHIQILAEEQAARGHCVTALVTGSGSRVGRTEEGGVLVVRQRSALRLRSTPLAPGLPLALRRTPADIVHLHFPYPPGEVAQLVAGSSRRTVLTYHCDIVRQRFIGALYRPLLRVILRRAHRIIVSSPALRSRSPLLSELGDRISIVPYGIRLPGADGYVERRLRQRWPGHRLLFVGRLRHYKGLFHLLRVMEQVPADLVVVGDGPLRRSLEGRVLNSPAGDRIHLVGEVAPAQLPAYYAAADLLVLPSSSRAEAFGIVQLEAMALGVPVVCSELGTGTSWVNQDGQTGRVVPPGDVEAWTTVIRDLLAHPEQRQRMGERARRQVADQFTAERMTEQVLEVYRSALAGGR